MPNETAYLIVFNISLITYVNIQSENSAITNPIKQVELYFTQRDSFVVLPSYLFHDYTRDQELDYLKKMNPYHPLMRVFIRFTSVIEENDLCGGKKVHSAYFSMRVPS